MEVDYYIEQFAERRRLLTARVRIGIDPLQPLSPFGQETQAMRDTFRAALDGSTTKILVQGVAGGTSRFFRPERVPSPLRCDEHRSNLGPSQTASDSWPAVAIGLRQQSGDVTPLS